MPLAAVAVILMLGPVESEALENSGPGRVRRSQASAPLG